MSRRPWLVHRPWYRIDLFAAMERLREWFGFSEPRAARESDRFQAKLEMLPMDWRNPPSESITNTLLPLAASAAGAAAALYVVAAFAADEDRGGVVAAAGDAAAGGDALLSPAGFDLTPQTVSPVGLASAEPLTAGDGVAAQPAAGDQTETDSGFSYISGDPPEGGMGGPGGEAGEEGGGAGGGSGVGPWEEGEPGGNTSGGTSTTGGSTTGGGSQTPPQAGTGNTGTPPPSSGGGFYPTTPGNGAAGESFNVNAGVEPGEPPVPAAVGRAEPRFVANVGQWDSSIDFGTRGVGYEFWVAGNTAVVALPITEPQAEEPQQGGGNNSVPGSNGIPGQPGGEAQEVSFDAIRMTWQGMDAGAQPVGSQRLGSTSNYLIGNDPEDRHTDVPEFGEVRYPNAWAGIDLVYRRADAGGLEYDLVVKPGADPSDVGFLLEGAQARVEDGRLVLTTENGAELVQKAPVLYQVAASGEREFVPGDFDLRPDGTVGFTVGEYDTSRDLVVDPELTYTTTLGGTGVETAYGVATDAAGNVYVGGTTTSTDFPATGYQTTFGGGETDGFVAKYDSTGDLLWSTYLGGDGTDYLSAVAVGPDGGVFVGGTASSDFPTTGGAFMASTPTSSLTGFVTKLAPDGSSLAYSTYYGGSTWEYGYGLAVDRTSGEAVLVGWTGSSDLPLAHAHDPTADYADGFVARFTADGSGLVFATYLGGAGSNDTAYGVAIDGGGNAVVVGTTDSSDFPARNGWDASRDVSYSEAYPDAFLAKFSRSGSLRASTFLGGAGYDTARAVAIDREGAIHVTGDTTSSDFPTVNPADGSLDGFSDAFVAKFRTLSSAPVYSTHQGTSGAAGYGIAVDRRGRAVVVGGGETTAGMSTTRYTASGAVDWSDNLEDLPLSGGFAAAVDRNGTIYGAGRDGSANVLLAQYGGVPAAPAITDVSDDTGSSDSDRITSDTTPTFTGTAVPDAGVTVYRRGPADPDPVVAGTTTADGGGAWSFTYPSALPAGVYRFTATATVAGMDSPHSAAAAVAIDTSAPALTVSVDASGYDRAPVVRVSAADLGGVSGSPTVVIDVDLNDDGDYLDSGEADYAAAKLVNGLAAFSGYTALPLDADLSIRARLPDDAGNGGTSDKIDFEIPTSPSAWTLTDQTAADEGGYGNGRSDLDGLMSAGDVSAVQALDLDASAGSSAPDPYLVYHSQEAAPTPVVQASLQSDNTLGLPDNVYGTLTWDGAAGSKVDYDLSGLSPGGEWVFGAVPTSSLATGRHTYSLALFVDYPGGGNDHLVTATGATFLVNRSASPYGAGWGLSAADALVPVSSSGPYPAGVLRVYGEGGWTFYPEDGKGGYDESDGGTLATAGGGGWTYTTPDNRVLTFNSSGQMTKWASPAAGEAFTYTYDASGGVATVANPDGSTATFTYASSLVRTIASPGGRTVTVTHSSTDAVQITNPAGEDHDFTYSAHRLTCDTTDTASTSYAYDANGFAASVTQGADPLLNPAAGVGLSAGMNAEGPGLRVATYTDALGYVWTRWYDRRGRVVRTLDPVGAVEAFVRNTRGHVVRYVDPLGRQTTFTVDTAGRVLGQTNADATAASWQYDGTGSLTRYVDFNGGVWTFTNDGDGNRLTATDPLNHTTTLTYASGLMQTMTSAVGDVTTYLYDSARRQTGVLIGGAVTGTMGYDLRGNANTFTDPLGNTTTATYDLLGRVRTVTDALGNVTSYAYLTGNAAALLGPQNNTGLLAAAGETSSGYLLSVTDALGHTTSYGYDAAGRPVTVIEALGTGLERRTTSAYDAVGQLVASVDALGNRTTGVYDPAGRLVSVVDALGNSTTGTYDLADQLTDVTDALGRVTHAGYDQRGRLTSSTDPLGNATTAAYDANSNPVGLVDPLGHRNTAAYDAADRLTVLVDGLVNRTSYGYDAADRLTSLTDPLGRTTTAGYDARGRAAFTQDALGGLTTTQYDSADKPVSVTDQLARTATTVYDVLNRVVASVDALGNRTTAVYDAVGNQVAFVDAAGNRATTVYDALNRAVERSDALGNRSTAVYDAADRVVASVDALGNRTTAVYDAVGGVLASVDALGNRTSYGYDAVGSLVSVEDAMGNALDPSGVTTYGYDALNRPVSVTDALGNTSTTTYDAAGRSVAYTDANGNTSTTVFDAADRAVAWVDALANRTSYGFDAASNLTTVTDPLGRVSTAAYDALNRAVVGIDALGNRTTAVYDAVGNITGSVDAAARRTTTTFDAADRPVAFTDALGNTWTTAYDAVGNAVSSTDPLGHTVTRVYDTLNRAVVGIDALGNRATATYDAVGDLLTFTDSLIRTTSYGYDARNMPVTTTDALGNVWTTVHDAVGRAVAFLDPLEHEGRVFYDEAGRMTGTADGVGARVQSVFDPAGNVVARIDPNGNITTLTLDAADRPVSVTDALGNVWTTTYDAASNPVAVTDPLGRTTTAVFDALNRQAASIDSLGNRATTVFDAVGNAVVGIDALNRRTTFGYDALDRVVTITDALGGVATVGYDAAGNFRTTVDQLGRATTTAYDARNMPVAFTDSLGNAWTTVFDAIGNAVNAIDPLNRTSTTVYDPLYRAVERIDPLGNVVTSVYDDAGGVTVRIDALGNATTFVLDERGTAAAIIDPLNNVTTLVYDDVGHVVAKIDALGRTTTSAYDALNRQQAVVDPLGNTTTALYDAASNRIAVVDALGRTTTAVFDGLNRQTAVEDALGNRSTLVFDAMGNAVVGIDALNRRTTAGYDALDRLVTITDALGGVSTTGFDAVGNVRTATDQLGRTTTTAYDARNMPVAVTDALGNLWTTAYDRVGNAVAFTDPLNHTSTTVFDAADRAVERIDALGNTTTSVFDAAGRVVERIDALGNATSYGYDARGMMLTVTDPLGNTSTTGYDAVGNAVARTDARGNTTTATFDALDRVSEVTDALGNTTTAIYDAVSNRVTVLDALGFATTSVFDTLDREIATVSPLGHANTTVYDAVSNVIATVNGAAERTSFGYDALDRQVTTTDPLGFVTTSAYDAVGNVRSLTDASGNRTTWVYDALDRVTAETNPLNLTSTVAYDAAGRKTGEMDRIGRRRDFGYDELNRMTTEKWYALGGGLTQTQTWTYDAVGQVLTARDPDGTYTFVYDEAGLVEHVDQPFGLSLTMTFDEAGNRTGVEDSRGGLTTVVFDELNRQESEQSSVAGGSDSRFDYAYNDRGERESLTRYADLAGSTVVGTTAYLRDEDGRLTHLLHTDGIGTVLGEGTYSYDAADRLTEKIEDGVTTSYSYDFASQLTRDGATTFGYDATGNRTNSGYVTGAGNRITTDGVWTYTFDPEGNLTKQSKGATGDTWVYGYDHRNQMTGAAFALTDGGTTTKQVTYTYDALGNRIERDAWDGTTAVVEKYGLDGWDTAKPTPVGNENFDPYITLDGSGTMTARRSFGTEFDEVVSRQDAVGTVGWYLADRQGSVTDVIDNAGGFVNSVGYSAYGEVTSGTPDDQFGFNGMELDPVTGLYLPLRPYNPRTGLFGSEDPKGFAAGDENLYGYVGNSPTNFTDPSGMWLYSYDGKNYQRFIDKVFKEWRPMLGAAPLGLTDLQWWYDYPSAPKQIVLNGSMTELIKKILTLSDEQLGGAAYRRMLEAAISPDAHLWIGDTPDGQMGFSNAVGRIRGFKVVDNLDTGTGINLPVLGAAGDAIRSNLTGNHAQGAVRTSEAVLEAVTLPFFGSAAKSAGTWVLRNKKFVFGIAVELGVGVNPKQIPTPRFVSPPPRWFGKVPGPSAPSGGVPSLKPGSLHMQRVMPDPNTPPPPGSTDAVRVPTPNIVAPKPTSPPAGTPTTPAPKGGAVTNPPLPTTPTPTTPAVPPATPPAAGVKPPAVPGPVTSPTAGQYSGGLVKVTKPDKAADSLAAKLGGESRVKFKNDPAGREFDAVSDKYVAQTNQGLPTISKKWRNEAKATFEAAKETGRTPYFHFEKEPSKDVINKIAEYEKRYGLKAEVHIGPLS